jgi:hypothetical protein
MMGVASGAYEKGINDIYPEMRPGNYLSFISGYFP